MLGNIFTFFQSLLSPRKCYRSLSLLLLSQISSERLELPTEKIHQFATFPHSSAMLGNMEAMFGHVGGGVTSGAMFNGSTYLDPFLEQDCSL